MKDLRLSVPLGAQQFGNFVRFIHRTRDTTIKALLTVEHENLALSCNL